MPKRAGSFGQPAPLMTPEAAEVGANSIVDYYNPPPGSRAGSTDIVVRPPSGVSDESQPETGFWSINQQDFNRIYEVDSAQSMDEAWNRFTSSAGIDALGVPTNWWPGLHLERPMIYERYSKNLGFTWGSDIPPPESWAASPRTAIFQNPDDPSQQEDFWVRYDPARAAQQYMLMGASERSRYSELMSKAGLLAEEWAGIGDFDPEPAAAFAQALAWANYWGRPVDQVLAERGRLVAELKKRAGGGGGGGGAGATFKASVPSYDTLLQEAKDLIQSKVGNRDVENWEMALVADEFQRQYGRWADASKAQALGGNGVYKIPDPQALTESFVEDQYASEISRLEDIGDNRTTNQVLISALTKGTEMAGGLG